MYGVDPQSGPFRIRLGSNGVETIGNHAGHAVADFRISPNKKWLFYSLDDSPGRQSYWLYDVDKGIERTASDIPSYALGITFSGDGEKLAWLTPSGGPESLSFIDLRTWKVRSYPVPRAEAGGLSILFGLAWSNDGERLLFGARPQGEGETYWSLDLQSGRMAMISATRDGKPSDPDQKILYSENGVVVGADCLLCGRPLPVTTLEAAGGIRVSLADRRSLIVMKPNGASRTIAEIPASATASSDAPVVGCIGHSIALLAVFDGRYVIYTHDGAYWVYGVEEDRKALLSDRPGTLLTW